MPISTLHQASETMDNEQVRCGNSVAMVLHEQVPRQDEGCVHSPAWHLSETSSCANASSSARMPLHKCQKSWEDFSLAGEVCPSSHCISETQICPVVGYTTKKRSNSLAISSGGCCSTLPYSPSASECSDAAISHLDSAQEQDALLLYASGLRSRRSGMNSRNSGRRSSEQSDREKQSRSTGDIDPTRRGCSEGEDGNTSEHSLQRHHGWNSSSSASCNSTVVVSRADHIEQYPDADSVDQTQSSTSSSLRQRRTATSTLADIGIQTTMTTMDSSYAEEETASFLPRGNAARKPRVGKRARACLTHVSRRRRAIAALCFVTTIGTLVYFFAPSILGEERMQFIDQKLDSIRPILQGIGMGPPPPPDGRPPPPPPKAAPIATTATGNKVYKPMDKLPPGYDDPIPYAEDSVRIKENAFPPEVVQSPVIVKPSDLAPQLDADPHHGQIPSVQMSRLSMRTKRQRPPKPGPVEPYPEDLYKSHGSWSAEKNGSRTSYLDALQYNSLSARIDWRPPPYDTWQPPKLLPGESALPTVQHNFSAPDSYSGMRDQAARDIEIQGRQQHVKNAFLYAWEAYKARAWGHDEIKPVTGEPSDSFNGWGATIVDALDTLLVMELPDEYDLARQHVRDIDFHLLGGGRSAYGTSDGRIPVFETAIRYLGGFLSAYDLSGDEVMRDRAEELAQLILPAFNTLTGVPLGRLRFDNPPNQQYATGGVILAEAASMLLEMTRLWQVTGNRTYFDSVQRTTDWLDRNMTGTPDRLGALLPTSIFPERGTMYGWYSWGGMVDSAYEYLIKEHQLLGGRLAQYGRMFADAVTSAQDWLIRDIHTVPNAPLLVFGHSNGRSFQPKLEHLTCFAGGTLGLGARLLPNRKRDLSHAERVTEACWWTYNATTTGIGPEELTFYRDKDTDRFDTIQAVGGASRRGKARGSPIVGVRSIQPDYRNRPETIESVFYMWRITGDPKWQERGWQMFSSWMTHGMSHYGFSSILNVMQVPVQHTDSMESFVFAETFKYYYLLFSPPSLISLDDYVFTTEAHPLLAPKKGKWARAGMGPRKLWDPPARHTPADPSEYAGGEMGPIGGLTHVQKTFLAAKHRARLGAIEAEKRAKENSLLNVVKVNSEHIRNLLQSNLPAGARISVDELKNAAADIVAQVGAQDTSAGEAPQLDEAQLEKRDLAEGLEVDFDDVVLEDVECSGPEEQHIDDGKEVYYDADGHGECPA